jgi:epoxyqueuosine reductase
LDIDCKDSIKEYSGSLGLELVGFSKCRTYSELVPYLKKRQDRLVQNEFEDNDINRRVNPLLNMENGKTIVSIAFPYFHGEDSCPQEGQGYFSKYTLGMDYHAAVSNYLKMICSHIEALGGKAAYFVDSNSLPERYIASLSGIGFIGKNNMLITRKYGSYVFLGEIITDLEMEEDAPAESCCGSCSRCIDACPTGSLKQDNPNICLSYITQKRVLEDTWLTRLEGRLFGCDTCQDACPFNEGAEKSALECFRPLEFMCSPDIRGLVFMSNALFREKYKRTSCGWRGKAILQRNALISLFLHDSDAGNRIKEDDLASPKLKDIYNRLLRIYKL